MSVDSRSHARRVRQWLGRAAYRAVVAGLTPVNFLLSIVRRRIVHERSVLHVSYMVHVPYNLTRTLREFGLRADYLAVGDSAVWNRSDFRSPSGLGPVRQALAEFRMLWSVLAKYQVIHLHFALTASESGWELPWLKRLGRRIVVHYRGCEARDRDRNMALHPRVNICQDCDYMPRICQMPSVRARRDRAQRYGDVFLVTTPDMLDFVPGGTWLPFFAPDATDGRAIPDRRARRPGAPFRIVHATNHPGIEGTARIQAAVDEVKRRGIDVELVVLKGVSPDRVLEETSNADLTIGKMKMGYYANGQIESLALGVPAITFVRPEFVTEDLEDSGLILTTLDDLADTIEFHLRNPDALAARRARARESVLRLHDNAKLTARLIDIYGMAPIPAAPVVDAPVPAGV